jgi:hypothetical protein
VIKAFSDSVGDKDRAWVVPNAHWVDTRLVGINAGYPEKDYALWPENLATTLEIAGAKLFIVRPSDQPSIDLLTQLYPDGSLETYSSKYENKDFYVYYVPP